MYLEQISLLNFRNLRTQKLKFSENTNVFFGDNAQGKTNLLEAIYLLSTSKSFRARADKELISWGETAAKIVGQASILEIEMEIHETRKSLLINKQPKRLTDLIGSFLTVLFTPNDIEIISGSPEKRRRFLDQVGVSVSRDYLVALARFGQILRARNQTLWQLKQGRLADLGVWDQQFAREAAKIWKARFELILKLQEALVRLGPKILEGELKVIFATSAKGETAKEMESRLLEELSEIRREEINKTLTQIGPQRDDFKILLEQEQDSKVVSKDLTTFGSRGEQRAASLALKLAEIEIIEAEMQTRPVLLLDDVLGELDQNHQKLLLRQLRVGQSFITTTNIETVAQNLSGKFSKFRLESGLVTSVD